MTVSKHWILVTTQPHRESWAAENIARQGHEFYLPRYRQQKILLGREVTLLKPVFPRYLFVRIEKQWRFLTGTWGVQGVVIFGEEPETVPDRVIKALRAREDENGFIVLDSPQSPAIKKGEQVVVIDGPLKGTLGLCMGQTNKVRYQILMKMLGREAVVSLDSNSLSLAKR